MSSAVLAETGERASVRVRGLVQGVGFRPFVAALAARFRLTGWVRNDDAGVLLEVQGAAIGPFLAALRREAPPLSRVEAVEVRAIAPRPGERGFAIAPSARSGRVSTYVGADTAPCAACLAELFDPRDRRYRYPFLTCTQCGPRFTLARALPWDRATTTMAPFALCASCAREYDDPRDRRFHAEATACAACGPRLSMPIEEIVARLREGQVVALKGVGGFHLACDATNESAVARLRAAKQRDGKPFAIMVAGVASASAHVALGEGEAALLSSAARPVVLARRRDGARAIAPSVAPGLAWLGVMLPSSPLHALLFHEAAGRPRGLAWLDEPTDLVLVMTSANMGGEPIVAHDDEARRRLAAICDVVVGHDRPIAVRCDDPVARVVAGAPMILRRGRGLAPEPIALSRSVPSVLATGAFLKNAVCVTRGERAFLSQHVGDLDDARAVRFMEETARHLLAILEVEPACVAHDLHPDFASTRFAESLGRPCLPVQHHHAHVAAVLAEHGRSGPHVGLALDGAGLGTDGGAWGGELLRVDGARFERLGHLRPLPLPGGDAAAREPWRMAAGALWAMGRKDEIATRWGAKGAALAAVLDRGVHCPETTGCGRWFDAACGILGVRDRSGYEGEAPMVLESLVRAPRVLPGTWRVERGVLDLLPLLEALRDMTPAEGADAFHGTLAAALVELSLPALEGARTIVLSGGCLANAVLAGALAEGFAAHGVEALLPRSAPPGDGGIALGQAWVAAHALEGG
jgi:hydrogenase maturation protein HypF